MYTKEKNRWKSILLVMMLVIFCCFPNDMVQAADSVSIKIYKAEISSNGKLQPGQSFSIKMEVGLINVPDDFFDTDKKDEKKELYFSEAYVSGAVKAESEPTVSDEGNEKITGEELHYITVSGLYYDGSGDSVNVSIAVGDNDSTSLVSGDKVLKISGYTAEEIAGNLSIDNSSNLVVKNNETQTVKVKITNKGNLTINDVKAKLSLDNKVKGLTIKNDTSECSNIKSKETKNATFSIAAAEDTKAGVYPATVTVLGNSFPVKIQVDSNIVPSALEVSMANNTAFSAGVEKEAVFEVRNVGDRDAKNVRIELMNTDNVSVIGNSNVKRLNLISAKTSQQVAMKVRVASSFKGEAIALPIKISYLSSTGEQTEDQQYVYLYVGSSQAASEVVISSVVSPTGNFDVDKNFTVKFNITAKSAASNIQITAQGDEGIVPKSQNLFFLNKAKSGETRQYAVTFAATREAVTSSHPIKITVTYGTGDDATTINQYGSVNIVNSKKDAEEAKTDKKDEVMKNKPKVIIGQYKIKPTIVQAGKKFEMEITFLNTSKEHTVHNLKANILPVKQESEDNNTTTDKGNVFTPVEGSNTIYISDLGVGQSFTKTLNMYTIPSATAKTYQITVDMAYEDEKGNENTASESLGIPVEQVTKIQIGDIYVDVGSVGSPTSFSATFYNRGRTQISNMMVYIEGEGFKVQENKDFIGTFEIGDSETYEPTLVPDQAGTLSGTLVIEYEDPNGTTQVMKEPFEFEVEEAVAEGDGMDSEEMQSEENPSKQLALFIGLGIGAAVIVVIAAVVIIKRKRAKRKESLLSDEDQED